MENASKAAAFAMENKAAFALENKAVFAMENKAAFARENKAAFAMENKAAHGTKVGSKGSDHPKRKHGHKHRKGSGSHPHCSCAKKLKYKYSGKNNTPGSTDNISEFMMENKQKVCARHGPTSPSMPPQPHAPHHRMGSTPVAPIVMPSTYVRPAQSEGSSTEVGESEKVIRPKLPFRRPPEVKALEVVLDADEGPSGTAGEFMEVTGSNVMKRDFDLNFPPPEYYQWGWN